MYTHNDDSNGLRRASFTLAPNRERKRERNV